MQGVRTSSFKEAGVGGESLIMVRPTQESPRTPRGESRTSDHAGRRSRSTQAPQPGASCGRPSSGQRHEKVLEKHRTPPRGLKRTHHTQGKTVAPQGSTPGSTHIVPFNPTEDCYISILSLKKTEELTYGWRVRTGIPEPAWPRGVAVTRNGLLAPLLISISSTVTLDR